MLQRVEGKTDLSSFKRGEVKLANGDQKNRNLFKKPLR